MNDPREVKERLVADACEAQRKGGHKVTVRENEEIFGEILRESDRKEAEAKPIYKTRDKSEEQAKADFDEELGKRQVKHELRTDGLGEYEVFRREIPREAPKKRTPFLKLPISKQRLEYEKRLLRLRLDQLKKKPEWSHRVKECIGNLMGARNKFEYAAAVGGLYDLVEKSNLTFGDWRKLPAQKIYFHGSGKGE